MAKSGRWGQLRQDWGMLTFYQRFESSVALVLTLIIGLIALLALVRKFIVLDIHEVSAEQMLGLAAITLALGTTYWLLRERDDRLARP